MGANSYRTCNLYADIFSNFRYIASIRTNGNWWLNRNLPNMQLVHIRAVSTQGKCIILTSITNLFDYRIIEKRECREVITIIFHYPGRIKRTKHATTLHNSWWTLQPQFQYCKLMIVINWAWNSQESLNH